MVNRRLTWMLPALLLIAAAPAAAQGVQANPEPGCSVSAEQLAANKVAALAFFTTAGDERVALIGEDYIQHNPAFVKGARAAGMSDYDYFVSRFGGPARGGGGGGGGGRGQAAGPQPPPGNGLEVVTAECDIVTVIHMNWRQDPTEPAGTFFQAYTFDSFRVRDGKLVEHWDAAVINPPQN
jgi:predicted SnoaL-like aldol condensation-catalyzing enzyme